MRGTASQELQELEKNITDPAVIADMAKMVTESLSHEVMDCLDD